MNVPQGMTADKLRKVAGWLDTFDQLAQAHFRLVRALKARGEFDSIDTLTLTEAEATVSEPVVQQELRAWADELSDPDPGWPEGSGPFDAPYTANKIIHWRDRNRLHAMADSLDRLDEETNLGAITAELRRISGDDRKGDTDV